MRAIDERLPVIAGSGMTGMAISIKLSQARIPHILVGHAPNDLPRLGESLNLEGTLQLLQLFPDLDQFCWPKVTTIGYIGDYILRCHFNLTHRLRSGLAVKLLGYTLPKHLLHIDRLGLDAAIFERAVGSPYCNLIDDKPAAARYDPFRDKVFEVELLSGQTLTPSYIFDCSTRNSVIAAAAGVASKQTPANHRVTFTHYHSQTGDLPTLEDHPWDFSPTSFDCTGTLTVWRLSLGIFRSAHTSRWE